MRTSGRNVVVGLLVLAAAACWSAPLLAEEPKTPLDEYLERYWGEKRTAQVVQKRAFAKDGRFSLTPYFGVIPNDKFFLFYPLGLRLGYWIVEDFGIQLSGSYMFSSESDLETFLREEMSGSTATAPRQILQWNGGVEALWSPIHSKIEIFNKKMYHFDLHLALGAGGMGTQVRTKSDGVAKEEAAINVYGSFGLGAQMFFADWGGIGLEYRQFLYPADKKVGGGVALPAEISLGFNWFFG